MASPNEPPKQPDKLAEGPCALPYEQIIKCAEKKGVNVSKHKLKMQACPSETDALIKCMNKHPKYFY